MIWWRQFYLLHFVMMFIQAAHIVTFDQNGFDFFFPFCYCLINHQYSFVIRINYSVYIASSVAVSAWTLVAIALERYYAICDPLRSRRWQTLKHAYKLIALIWCGSFLFMLPIAFFSRLIPTSQGKYIFTIITLTSNENKQKPHCIHNSVAEKSIIQWKLLFIHLPYDFITNFCVFLRYYFCFYCVSL